jgi:LAS superfamily LD-carboxypeptidase LdcB
MKNKMGYSRLRKFTTATLLAAVLVTNVPATGLEFFGEVVQVQAAERQGQTTAALNFRTGPGTQHSIIRTLARNTQIRILSESNGWMNIQVGNQTGYVSAEWVQVTNVSAPSQPVNPPSTTERQGRTTAALNFRTGAGTNHSIIRTLANGTNLTILSESNGWMNVRVGTQTGWVSAEWVRVTTASTPSAPSAPAPSVSAPAPSVPAPAPSTPPSNSERQGQTTAALNFRTGAGTNHSIIRTLANGTNLTILSESNGWMNVRVGSQTGWVNAQWVRVTTTSTPSAPPSSNNERQGQTTAALNFRTGASTSHSIIRTLANGTSLTILSESNGWMNVRVGSQTGWVNAQWVRVTANSNVQFVADPHNILVLVNQSNRLPSNFTPNDLVVPRLRNANGGTNSTMTLRREAATQAEALFAAAGDAGHELMFISGFRTYELQTRLFNDFVRSHGLAQAERFSARPGHSEHQTGLALDVSARSVNGQLVQRFSTTAEGTWVRENAHRFGFIISYPEGREAETGFMYEPWHIRFVGVDAATRIHQNGWILEQFLNR